jgi:hypothetical protein
MNNKRKMKKKKKERTWKLGSSEFQGKPSLVPMGEGPPFGTTPESTIFNLI